MAGSTGGTHNGGLQQCLAGNSGLNSHAAIAGKALLKPTVVGAAGATSHIRDGLMVAVDCAHGSVQRLQA